MPVTGNRIQRRAEVLPLGSQWARAGNDAGNWLYLLKQSSVGNYREFQFGWVLLILILAIQGLTTFFLVSQIGARPLTLPSYLESTGVLSIIVMLFHSMRIRIDSSQVVVLFGVGLIRKKIDLNRVKSLEIVKNPWYYGWGLRLLPNGWLYNISGADAIEIKFVDTNRSVRIGTKDPHKLIGEINARMNRS